jgi:20S proteasome alpha/beta subunit
MTLCIAALAIAEGAAINETTTIFCTDTRVETHTTGAETGFKFRKVNNSWGVMFAGKVGRAEELIGMFETHLPEESLEDSAVMDALRIPPQNFKKILASEYIANMTGLPFDDFHLRGSSALPPSLFENLSNDVARIEIGCQLILAPIPSSGHLYSVDIDGSVNIHQHFCTIGTGSSNAEAWLYYQAQNRFLNLQHSIVHLLEAKRFSENAPGVGKKTDLYWISHDLKTHSIFNEEKLEESIWRRYGPRSTRKTKIKLEEIDDPPDWKDIGRG